MHPFLTLRRKSFSNPKLPAIELALAAVLLGVTTPRAAAQTPAASPIIADGAQVEKVGSGYGFTEGCTADKDGNVFFTDDGAQVEKAGSGYGFTEGCTADKDGNVFFTDQNHEPGGQILR
jgi:hypothetical protein